ncbi:GCSAM [Cervus elaphus hippelaphus]|uniref:GCSAM n=1 Tax=Cervus elaphus hippelaphus TaxID=46360 RepID=A0A212C3T2_CEREH|nr:GCSAM [Cervus elaphus hippelaphus]
MKCSIPIAFSVFLTTNPDHHTYGKQENGDQGSSEDLCYTLINHSVLGKRPSGISAEESYENVSLKAERPRASLGGTETEYSLLRVPSAPKHPSSPEDDAT